MVTSKVLVMSNKHIPGKVERQRTSPLRQIKNGSLASGKTY